MQKDFSNPQKAKGQLQRSKIYKFPSSIYNIACDMPYSISLINVPTPGSMAASTPLNLQSDDCQNFVFNKVKSLLMLGPRDKTQYTRGMQKVDNLTLVAR